MKMVKAKNPSFVEPGLKLMDAGGEDRDSRDPESRTGKTARPCSRPARTPKSRPEIADQIGLQLRSLYDDVLAQPVPGRFLDLLKELENRSGSRRSKDRM